MHIFVLYQIMKFLRLLPFLWVYPLYAQEPIMTNYQFNHLEFNPSYYGAAPCHSCIVQSRQQWLGLNGPFRFNNATVSFNPLPEFGTGIKLIHGSEGIGAYQSNAVLTGASWSVPLPKNLPWKQSLHFGLELGASQKRIDWSQLVFTSEIHPYLGYLGNTTSISPQNTVSNFYVSQGVGFHYRLNHVRNGSGFRIGGAWTNNFYPLEQQSLSFFDESSLHTRYVLHSSVISNGKNFDRVYAFKYDRQASLSTAQFTYSIGDGVRNFGDDYLTMGFLGFRNERFPTAVFNSFLFGFTQTYNDILIGVSYDTNIGRLSSNYTYGTFEVSFRKNFCWRKLGRDECFYDNWLDEDKMYRKWEQ